MVIRKRILVRKGFWKELRYGRDYYGLHHKWTLKLLTSAGVTSGLLRAMASLIAGDLKEGRFRNMYSKLDMRGLRTSAPRSLTTSFTIIDMPFDIDNGSVSFVEII